jgi:uncharacterized membrane protein
MSTNPYQGQTPEQSNQYGGYTGYTPPTQNNTSGTQQYGSNTSEQDDYQYGQYTYGQGQQQQQQYGTYQPPQSTLRGRSGASSGTSETDDMTSLGINGRTAAAASYILLFLSGIVIFFLERKNRFVRFCAVQSVLLFGSLAIILEVVHLLTIIPILGAVFIPIFGILEFLTVVLWIVLTITAYLGKKIKLPFFGDYAERLVSRFTK